MKDSQDRLTRLELNQADILRNLIKKDEIDGLINEQVKDLENKLKAQEIEKKALNLKVKNNTNSFGLTNSTPSFFG